ncbi:MAG: hypothetical protein VX017_02040 [Pseudomonadota bacterium]|nr:hypothetical protein [Pseudomonadota bacterium]
MVARALRGIPIVDWRSDSASGLKLSGTKAQGEDQSGYLADKDTSGDSEEI